MGFLLKNKFILALFCLLAIAFTDSFATAKKLPLSPKRYGDVNYLEWTGTAVSVLSADTLSFYSDTANSYGLNPFNLLFNEQNGRAESQIYPGKIVFEKICGHFVGNSGYASLATTDNSIARFDMYYSTSRNGTFYRADQVSGVTLADSANFTSTSYAGAFVAFPAAPGLFFIPKMRTSTATDTSSIVSARFWGCND